MHSSFSEWEVTTVPEVAGDATWRCNLIDWVRRNLVAGLQQTHDRTEFRWSSPLFEVTCRRVGGDSAVNSNIRLHMGRTAGVPSQRPVRTQPQAPDPTLLPDVTVEERTNQVSSLSWLIEEGVVRLRCAWDDALAEYLASQPADALAPAQLLTSSVPVFVFSGPPGTGKSSVAEAIANRYCSASGRVGQLFHLGTEARGNGLVGSSSERLRSALEAACSASDSGSPSFLLIDEAEALAVRRSEVQSHQEDRAATASLIQLLDRFGRQSPPPRLAVFLTTNLITQVDAALRRRAFIYTFLRPDRAARRAIFAEAVRGVSSRGLNRLATASSGMTGADIRRAIDGAFVAAVCSGQPLDENDLHSAVRKAERTSEV